MRNILIAAGLVAGLACSAPAFAAPATPATAATPATHAMASKEKTMACQKSWKAEKPKKGTRKAFMKSCLAKG